MSGYYSFVLGRNFISVDKIENYFIYHFKFQINVEKIQKTYNSFDMLMKEACDHSLI